MSWPRRGSHSGFAFIFGAVNFFKRKVALYAQLITCAMGCFALSYLFEMILIYANGVIPTGFQVGNLGLIGGMAFLFTSSYGQMDGLVDDKTPTYHKWRVAALLAPAVILLLYLPSFFASTALQTRLVTLVQFAFIGPAAYYNLKHLIIPDVELGIIKSIRAYDLVALLLEFFITLELVAINLGKGVLMAIFSVIVALLFVMMTPTLKHGMKKWTL